MKKVWLIIFAALMVAGAVVSYFSSIELVDYLSLAVSFGAAGALCSTTIGKATKKDWKVYVAVFCIAVGCFGLGFCGVATDVMSKAISGIAGIIAVIVGIFSAISATKSSKKTE